MQNQTDPRPLLNAAIDQMTTLIGQADRSDAGKPTPCSEFDVAGLVGHIQAVARRGATILTTGTFEGTPTQIDSADWPADWADGVAQFRQAMNDDASLARQVTVPWGRVPGAGMLGMYAAELIVHGWDLASATGAADSLNSALAEAVLPVYQQVLPAELRGGEMPFAPVVEVSDDAGAYERLVAWSGRDPRPWS